MVIITTTGNLGADAEAKQINLDREENEKPVELESEPDEQVETANDNEV